MKIKRDLFLFSSRVLSSYLFISMGVTLVLLTYNCWFSHDVTKIQTGSWFCDRVRLSF